MKPVNSVQKVSCLFKICEFFEAIDRAIGYVVFQAGFIEAGDIFGESDHIFVRRFILSHPGGLAIKFGSNLLILITLMV